MTEHEALFTPSSYEASYDFLDPRCIGFQVFVREGSLNEFASPFVRRTDGMRKSLCAHDYPSTLWPLRGHQRVFAHQDFADIFGANDSYGRFPENVRHVDVTIRGSSSFKKLRTLKVEQNSQILMIFVTRTGITWRTGNGF